MLKNFRKIAAYAFILSVVLSITIFSQSIQAAPGVSQQMNFQGRLLNSQGALVPDGFYNIEFKIYKDGDGLSAGNTTGTPAGTLQWTEAHLNSNSQGIRVKNGFMSVQLGSINPFGTQVDWNQDTLWLSMNIGSTDTVCTPFSACNPDGEMLPMKRLSSSPYAMNSNFLGGLSSAEFLQLARGVQTDASTNTASIHINKTGTGNFMTLQSQGIDTFTLSGSGDILMGNSSDHSISIATASDDTNGKGLTLSAGNGGDNGTGSLGGTLVLQGGEGSGLDGTGGNVAINAGSGTGSGSDGAISIGTSNSSKIQIGNDALASGTQDITVGANTGTGTTNVTVGSTELAGGGSTTVQAKDMISIRTDGIARATIDTTGSLYLGNGVSASTPSDFTVQGTNSTSAAIAGGSLTLQGGNATLGNTNGGSLILAGGLGTGTGANGLVVLQTPTFSTTANDPNCFPGGTYATASCTVAQSSIDSSAAVVLGFNVSGLTATLPNPTIATAGRVIYVTAAPGSSDFTLAVNGGGVGNVVAMRQNTSATMIWNGSAWTAAGASSSTTLQAAYDNTLQSAGGAELVVSSTSTTNGLTIRDSAIDPVNGTLFGVQTSSAAGLISISSDVTEYSSSSGAEIPGSGGPNTHPDNSWSPLSNSVVSRHTTAGNFIATGQGSVSIVTDTSAGSGVKNTLTTALNANMNYNVSFTSRLDSGTFTDLEVAYSADGTNVSVPCTANKAVTTSVWTKINCAFTAPASGITTSNAIFIRQENSGTARTFYVDNLSVTLAADYNYAADANVSDAVNFASNWSAVGSSTVTRNTSLGFNASDSAQVDTTGVAGQGVRGRLAINPLADTLYRITVYAASDTAGFVDFTARYSPNGGTNFIDCADYNTRTVSSSTTDFTKITCYVMTDTAPVTDPYVYFTQSDTASRTFYVDAFSMTLSTKTTPNVQIGGGVNGGPTTLLTLDRGASAPIASDNDALLGSMYYDTTLGKLQCYESDGWGACGSSPDNVVTISPEYNNAVMHGTGVGTMTADICSDSLNINDGSMGQPTICGTNETFNFYKWTSPQASAQTYSIYVTYQLPGTFQDFASGQTSIMGRSDSSNAIVTYQIYRNDPDNGLSACGTPVDVSSGVVTSWQTGIASGASDPSTCNFEPGNSIVFKINMTASQNASAYIGNLNFTFNNQ